MWQVKGRFCFCCCSYWFLGHLRSAIAPQESILGHVHYTILHSTAPLCFLELIIYDMRSMVWLLIYVFRLWTKWLVPFSPTLSIKTPCATRRFTHWGGTETGTNIARSFVVIFLKKHCTFVFVTCQCIKRPMKPFYFRRSPRTCWKSLCDVSLLLKLYQIVYVGGMKLTGSRRRNSVEIVYAISKEKISCFQDSTSSIIQDLTSLRPNRSRYVKRENMFPPHVFFAFLLDKAL